MLPETDKVEVGKICKNVPPLNNQDTPRIRIADRNLQDYRKLNDFLLDLRYNLNFLVQPYNQNKDWVLKYHFEYQITHMHKYHKPC